MKGSVQHLTDEQLVQQLKQGNRLAFSTIYDLYWKRLFVYAYRIFEDEHICEDIVQEVFIRLWQRAGEVAIDNLEAYLFQSVKFRVSNAIRNLKFKVDHEKALAEVSHQEHSSDVVLELKELSQEIDKTIELLPDKCREVFLLSRKEQLSNKEIAEKLGLSIRTVETHIYQAIKLIRKHVQKVAFYIILSQIM